MIRKVRNERPLCRGILILTLLGVGLLLPQIVVAEENALDGKIEEEPIGTLDQARATLAVLEIDGAIIEFFHDPPSGTIGIVEVSDTDKPSTLLSLSQDGDVSALEIYLHLNPTGHVPEQFLEDHLKVVELYGRTDVEPRVLTPRALPDKGVSSAGGTCQYNRAFIGDSQWAQWWHDNTRNKDFHRHWTYLEKTIPRSWTLPFPTYHRWLGACKGYWERNDNPFYFEVKYRRSNGSWRTTYSRYVDFNKKVGYYSNGGSLYWKIRLEHDGSRYNLPRRNVGVAYAGRVSYPM